MRYDLCSFYPSYWTQEVVLLYLLLVESSEFYNFSIFDWHNIPVGPIPWLTLVQFWGGSLLLVYLLNYFGIAVLISFVSNCCIGTSVFVCMEACTESYKLKYERDTLLSCGSEGPFF